MAIQRSSTKVEGFKELDDALAQLPKATRRNVIGRVMKTVLTPMLEAAKQNVPVRTGKLRESLAITAKRHRGVKKVNEVERYLATQGAPHAHLQEFGTVDMAANPYMRPAWDAGAPKAAQDLQDEMWKEITKATERARRKAERMARKAGS